MKTRVVGLQLDTSRAIIVSARWNSPVAMARATWSASSGGSSAGVRGAALDHRVDRLGLKLRILAHPGDLELEPREGIAPVHTAHGGPCPRQRGVLGRRGPGCRGRPEAPPKRCAPRGSGSARGPGTAPEGLRLGRLACGDGGGEEGGPARRTHRDEPRSSEAS